MAIGRADKEFLIQVKADINDAVRQMRQMTGEMQSQQGAATKLSGAMGTLKAALGGIAITQLAREVVRTSLAFEQMGNKLVFATGSTTKARQEMEFLRAEAKRLGIDLLESGKAYTSIAAAARGTALEGDGVREVFSSVAEASRVMGLTADQTAGALKALEQIISKGTVQAEELRGQLGERIPGAFQIAARAIGVTTQELGDMLQAGELLSEDFIPRFAAQLRKEVAGALPEAVDTAAASFARLGNAVAELQNSAGTSGFIDALASGAEILADNMDLVAEAAKVALVALAALAANRVGVSITEIGKAAVGSAKALLDASKGAGALTIAMRTLGGGIKLLGGPITALITLLGAGITAWALWGNAAESAYAKAKRKSEELADTVAGIRERLANEENFGTGDLGAVRQYIEEVQNQIDVLAQSRSDEAAAKLAKLRAELEELQTLERKLQDRQSTSPLPALPALPKPEKPGKTKTPRRDPNEASVKSLEFEAETYGKTTKEIALYRLQLDGATKAQLARAAAALDAIAAEEALAKSMEDMAEAERQAGEAAAQQNAQLDQQAQYWQDLTNPANAYQRQLEEIERLYESGRLSVGTYQDAVLSVLDAFDEMGKKAEETASDMDQFMVQAARNMQSTLADGFFDIMQGKFDNLGDSFKALLDRMVANALAANVAEAVFGDFGKTGKVGGIAGDLLSGLFGSVLHSGGIVGAAAPQRRVPLLAAANAPRYHSSGVIGLAADERVGVLEVGEEVLKRSDPRHRLNGGGTQITVINNLPNVQDVPAFRREEPNIVRGIGRAIKKQTGKI